jgi:flagellar motor protein MotB
MRGRRKRSSYEDSNSWVAYTDLLTTLLTFFIIIAFAGLAHVRSLNASAHQKELRGDLRGRVFDGAMRQSLEGCDIRLGEAETKTDGSGRFDFRDLVLSAERQIQLTVTAEGYNTYEEKIEFRPGTNSITVYLLKSQEESGEGELKVELLEGDAYFELSKAEVKPEALAKLVELGKRFHAELKPDEVIVVQGHTDDLPFKVPGKSNWELSGERAASVCRIFQEPEYGVGIPGKQIIAMGYGEFRPQTAVESDDSTEEANDKRARNRRIEIRKLKGAVFTSNKL